MTRLQSTLTILNLLKYQYNVKMNVFRMGNKKRISAWTWTYGVILAGLVLTAGLSSCGKKHISFTDE